MSENNKNKSTLIVYNFEDEETGKKSVYEFEATTHPFNGHNNIMLRHADVLKMLMTIILKSKQNCSKGNKNTIVLIQSKNNTAENIKFQIEFLCRAVDLKNISPYAFIIFLNILFSYEKILTETENFNPYTSHLLSDWDFIFNSFKIKRKSNQSEEEQIMELLNPLTKITLRFKSENNDKDKKDKYFDGVTENPLLVFFDSEEGKRFYINPFFWLDYFVFTKQCKSITPNFLIYSKKIPRLMILALCLELNEPNESYIKLPNAIAAYTLCPAANLDKNSKLKKKERIINDLKTVQTGLFSDLKLKIDNKNYTLEELANSSILTDIDLNDVYIFYKINKEKLDYPINFETNGNRESYVVYKITDEYKI